MYPAVKMIPSTLIELVPKLGLTNVKIKDPHLVERLIKTMRKDSHQKLQIIADFDHTLSKFSENGKVCSTTHAVIEESEFVPEHFQREATRLSEYYMAIEFDESKTEEEKIPKMIEWWSKGHDLLASCGLTKEKVSQAVAASNARLRNGCVSLFDMLHRLDVPLLLFSAGIGDVIMETITQQATFHPNMKLISNFIHFDDEGNMVGFSGTDIIHTFNKNESSLLNSDYFDKIKHCENILLLGDSLGDLKMAHGAQNMKCLLKIGFLNFKVEENLPVYLDNFDVVIVEDESVDVVSGIVQAIVGTSS